MPKSQNQGKIFKNVSEIQEGIMWNKELQNSFGTNQVYSSISLNEFHYVNRLLACICGSFHQGDREVG